MNKYEEILDKIDKQGLNMKPAGFLSNKPSKDAKTIHNITRVKSNSKRQIVCFQNPYFQTCLTNDNLFALFLVGYNNIDCIHGWETGWLQNPAPVGRW